MNHLMIETEKAQKLSGWREGIWQNLSFLRRGSLPGSVGYHYNVNFFMTFDRSEPTSTLHRQGQGQGTSTKGGVQQLGLGLYYLPIGMCVWLIHGCQL